MRWHSKIILSLLLIAFLISGCSSNKYDKFDKEFTSAYLVVADAIDIKDIYASVERLQSSTNQGEIEKMKKLLDEIKTEVPKKDQRHYEMLSQRYEGVVFLRDSYDKWDVLSQDEKSRIGIEVSMIAMRKDELK